MLLTSARITLYKSIDDSGDVPIDSQVTVLVGQNESGKTAFLQALHKTRPIQAEIAFDVTEDYPRRTLNEYKRQHASEPATVARLSFRLSDKDIAAIHGVLGAAVLTDPNVVITYKYGGGHVITQSTSETPYVDAIIRSVALPAGIQESVGTNRSVAGVIAALKGADLNAEGETFLKRLEATFAKTPEGWGAIQWHVWKAHVEPRIPRFVYFGDYNLLPGKVNLASLKQARDNGQLDEEDRTVLALLRLAGVDLDELLGGRGYEDVKANLEAFSNSVTDRVFQYWKQNQDLDVEFDIRSDPKDRSPFNSGPNLYIRIKSRRHRVSVPFNQRSKGFIWFFSFLVWFDSVKEQAETESDLILLLDEPGLSLHGLAQEDLLNYIDDLSKQHQVLYSTHSPFMVRSERLHQVRLVEDRVGIGTKVSSDVMGSDPATVFPLQAALGYTIAQNLFISKKNLLVEGPADLLYLRHFADRLDEKGRTPLRDDLTVVPVGGLDKLATFVALLGANALEMVVLHDSTGSPDQRLEMVVREKLISRRQVINYAQFAVNGVATGAAGKTSTRAADVEDLFTPATYLGLFNAAFKKELGGVALAEADLPSGDRIVERINRLLKDRGIQLRPSGGFNHYRVANHLASNPRTKVDAATLTRFENLFRTVNGVFDDA